MLLKSEREFEVNVRFSPVRSLTLLLICQRGCRELEGDNHLEGRGWRSSEGSMSLMFRAQMCCNARYNENERCEGAASMLSVAQFGLKSAASVLSAARAIVDFDLFGVLKEKL
jgi:hypothetical protein